MKNALWQTVLGEIELTVSRASFMTWFKNTELLESEDGNIIIAVPNIFAKQQLEVKFSKQISDTLAKNGVDVRQITYAIQSTNRKKVGDIAKKSNVAQQIASQQPRVNSVRSAASGNGLNPKYTFDTFIVGSSNELAYTACQAVANSPGTKYNPLFLYGGVGLGKTHLIQAVGNAVKCNPCLNSTFNRK